MLRYDTRRIPWGQRSVFAADAPVVAQDILPSLLAIPDYVRPGMRARFARRSLWVSGYESLSLAAQQHACLAFLRKLGIRYLQASSMVRLSAPFRYQFMLEVESSVSDFGHVAAPPQALDPLNFSNRQATRVVFHTRVPACMLHIKGARYLRVNLVGMRSGHRRPIPEWAHRVVCWMFHGPPPSDPGLMSQPELGRWHSQNWVVGHLCGCAGCLCPSHLAWLRPQDNVACEAWHRVCGKGALHLWPGV